MKTIMENIEKEGLVYFKRKIRLCLAFVSSVASDV